MRWTVATIVVLALAAGLWWLEQERQTDLHQSIEPPARSETAPEPRYPLPVTEPETPREAAGPAESESAVAALPEDPAPQPPLALPDLAESDPEALDAVADLTNRDFVEQWIKPEFVIPRTVALVNSLDGAAPALRIRPIRTLESEPLTAATQDEAIREWTDANARRYEPFIEALESAPPKRAAEVYARHYPLFQAAWEELGEAEPYFNDRLIDIIDHLLATPEVPLPISVRPYEGRLLFVNDAHENRSWGQKSLLRIGPDHARRVTTWLEQFRQALVSNGELPEASSANAP